MLRIYNDFDIAAPAEPKSIEDLIDPLVQLITSLNKAS